MPTPPRVASRSQRVDGAEVGRQRLSGVLADVADGQCIDESGQRHGAAGRDRLDQLRGGPVGESLQRQQLLDGDVEQVRRLGHISEIEQLVDHSGTEAFDVHCSARREVDEQLTPLRGTEWIHAAPHHLSLLADKK